MRKIFLILTVFFVSGFACRPPEPASATTVVRVIDGDTIEVRLAQGAIEKVRLIGIDTPETVDPRRPVQCFGKEASAHLKELLIGRVVQLEREPQNDDRDKYGRLLRYVFVADEFINQKMVSDGYAYAYTKFPFAFKNQFINAQREARIAQRGLWSPLTCGGRR